MKKIIITAVLFLNTLSYSQEHDLGKVTIDELKEKVCPMDTSAVAAVLFSVGKTKYNYTQTDGFELITEINTKIKIYKKEGYEYANKVVGFYSASDGSSEKVDISKAYTYNLVNNKIEKTKLNSNGEFLEKVNKFWSRKKITMPNVKEGSIIEFKIVISSPYERNIPEWQFQENIPVVFSEYTTYIPEYYFFNIRYKGYLFPTILKEKKTNSVILTSKERINSGGGFNIIAKSSFSNETITYEENKTRYTLEKIPALKEEAFVNNIDNYRASILHEIAGTRFPNGNYKDYSTDWESVTSTIYKNQNFGDELIKTGYFEKDLDVIINGINSYEEKIATIFNYTKSRMNWNETYGIYCDDGVRKAYQDKKGNVAEINLMLTAMLRYAGIEANPILVSTRSNGIPLFPSRTTYNYVICGVELQNQVVLLDATNIFSLPNILPVRALNWNGRIIRKNESSAEIYLMPKSNSKDIVSIIGTINDKGEVIGKIRDQYFDYNAFIYRQAYSAVSKDSYIEKLEKEHQGLEIGEFEVQNTTDLSKPIVENYNFTSTNSVEIIGDKMYVSPFLFFGKTENPFKQETREYPVDFVFPTQEKYQISLNMPEGYAVEVLPAPIAVAMPDNIANFKYNVSNIGSQVQVLFTLDINQTIIGPKDYEILKNFYREVVAKQTEKVVLKKV